MLPQVVQSLWHEKKPGYKALERGRVHTCLLAFLLGNHAKSWRKKKQCVLRNSASKRKKGFRGTQKQEVAQKRRKQTRAVEVTSFGLVGEDDVKEQCVKKKERFSGNPETGGSAEEKETNASCRSDVFWSGWWRRCCQRANSALRRIYNTAKRLWQLLEWNKLLKMTWRLPKDTDLSQWTVFLNLCREFTHKLHVISVLGKN